MACLGLWACGDDGGGAAGADTGDGAVLADAGDAVDTSAPDTAADVGPDTAADTGAGPDVPPEAGAFGAPCDSSAECFSGWCVAGPGGTVCSRACADNCPPDWECAGVFGPDVGAGFICLHRLALLCQPCVEHRDCNQLGQSLENRCVSRGDEGSFCGVACADDGDCPEGYACEGVEPGEPGQCVPTGGVCACNGYGVALGASTGCQRVSAAGACRGARTCEEGGLTACDAPEPAPEACNNADDDCDGATDEGLGGEPCKVATEEGLCAGTTGCQAGQTVCLTPGKGEEICNGVDDDCDELVDEGFVDTDGDGAADCVDEDDDGDGAPDAEDCAPLDPAISPLALELCNGIDEDCDGDTDEPGGADCTTWWQDRDGDGWGGQAACLCAPDPAGFFTATKGGDCDDLSASVNPDAVEVCNLADDDCDGQTNEGFPDTDEDGVPDCLTGDFDGDGSPNGQDCAPLDPAISPLAKEKCNGVDDDCDGDTDEANATGCAPWFRDQDGDGAGADAEPPLCLCAPSPATFHTAAAGGDCNDLDGAVGPGAEEVCNGVDDDCDGATDPGFPDADGDGIANCADADDDGDGTPDDLDCKPLDPLVHPASPEVCNGVDDDCDTVTDGPDTPGCTPRYRDLDEDGAGSDAHPAVCLCAPDPDTGYTALAGGDCDDADPAQKPGAAETCNGEDDDCDGATDEGLLSPCGDCSALCAVEVGPQGQAPFEPTAGVVLSATGGLTLEATPGAATWSHTFEGWPSAPTLWDLLLVSVAGGAAGVATVDVRWRAADTPEALAAAPWEGPAGPYPPAFFPLDLGLQAALLEIELTLTSTAAGAAPVVGSVEVIAHAL